MTAPRRIASSRIVSISATFGHRSGPASPFVSPPPSQSGSEWVANSLQAESWPRTNSGRLSGAYKTAVRDKGTPEFLEKRAYLINGADPQLAATASGILLANGFSTEDQHHAALRYAGIHALIFGKPWSTAPGLLGKELGWHATGPVGGGDQTRGEAVCRP